MGASLDEYHRRMLLAQRAEMDRQEKAIREELVRRIGESFTAHAHTLKDDSRWAETLANLAVDEIARYRLEGQMPR